MSTKFYRNTFLKSPFDGKKLSCIDIASLKMSKNLHSRLVYCKISDDIAVDRGCLLLGITNPRAIFFYLAIFKIKSAYLFYAFLRQKSLT